MVGGGGDARRQWEIGRRASPEVRQLKAAVATGEVHQRRVQRGVSLQ
jgi:hypothetical protein